MESNPNHPVTNEIREQYHKLLAFCVWKFGYRSGIGMSDDTCKTLTITSYDLQRFIDERPEGTNLVVEPKDRVLTLRIVGDVEGAELARKAGGLPS